MEISPDLLSELYAAFSKDFERLYGPGSVQSRLIRLHGHCPSCGRDLKEVAAADQQLNRGQCSCGKDLPTDWREQLRSYRKATEWLDLVPKFKRWVPVQDDRPSCLAGTRADLQNRFSIRSMEFTAAELAEAQRR